MVCRSKHWWDKIVNGAWNRKSPARRNFEWRKAFRLDYDTFEALHAELAPFISGKPVPDWHRSTCDSRKRLAMTLYRLATGAAFNVVGTQFGVADNTCGRITQRVTSAMCQNLLAKYVKPPAGQDLASGVAGFAKKGFPLCVGAVDGCHVRIAAPQWTEWKEAYHNRKQHFSIQLQGTVDFYGRFTNINIGWPGRVHDARIWDNSTINAELKAGTHITEPAWTEMLGKAGTEHPPRAFNQFYLLGDAANSGAPHLLKGFTGSRLKREEDYINFKLSGAHMCVERAFGQLKGRWKILDQPTRLSTLERSIDYIGACCILHNFCEVRQQYFADKWNSNVAAERIRQEGWDLRDASVDENDVAGTSLREALMAQMPVASNWKRRNF